MKIIFKKFKFPSLSGKMPGRLTIAHQVESTPQRKILTPVKVGLKIEFKD